MGSYVDVPFPLCVTKYIPAKFSVVQALASQTAFISCIGSSLGNFVNKTHNALKRTYMHNFVSAINIATAKI